MIGAVVISVFAVVVAQGVEGHPFWETPIGVAIGWVSAVAMILGLLGGGVVGIRTLYRAWRSTDSIMVERRRRGAVLDRLLSKDGWRNGAADIVAAHNDLWDKVDGIASKVDTINLRLIEFQTAIESVIERRRDESR